MSSVCPDQLPTNVGQYIARLHNDVAPENKSKAVWAKQCINGMVR